MIKPQFDIERIDVAKPCSVPWETMRGDERKRSCDMCSLTVYNFAEMTPAEIGALIGAAEDRICARIYRRADGTMLTRDCPVGVSAYRKRIARFAGAALSMVLGLFTFASAQSTPKGSDSERPDSGVNAKDERSSISGTLIDPHGAVIPGFAVVIKKDKKDKGKRTLTNEEGVYTFSNLDAGEYIIEISGQSGFETKIIENILLDKNEKKELNIELGPVAGTVVVGTIGEAPMIDISRPGGTTVITSDMVRGKP